MEAMCKIGRVLLLDDDDDDDFGQRENLTMLMKEGECIHFVSYPTGKDWAVNQLNNYSSRTFFVRISFFLSFFPFFLFFG